MERRRASLPPTAVVPGTGTVGTGTARRDGDGDCTRAGRRAPAGPLTEPLVGTSDPVVVDTATGRENQWYIFRCGVNQAWGAPPAAGW